MKKKKQNILEKNKINSSNVLWSFVSAFLRLIGQSFRGYTYERDTQWGKNTYLKKSHATTRLVKHLVFRGKKKYDDAYLICEMIWTHAFAYKCKIGTLHKLHVLLPTEEFAHANDRRSSLISKSWKLHSLIWL